MKHIDTLREALEVISQYPETRMYCQDVAEAALATTSAPEQSDSIPVTDLTDDELLAPPKVAISVTAAFAAAEKWRAAPVQSTEPVPAAQLTWPQKIWLQHGSEKDMLPTVNHEMMQQVLDAMRGAVAGNEGWVESFDDAINTLTAALAAPAQDKEPKP